MSPKNFLLPENTLFCGIALFCGKKGAISESEPYLMHGWIDEMVLTSDELRSGFLPTVWDLTRRLIWRQMISQF